MTLQEWAQKTMKALQEDIAYDNEQLTSDFQSVQRLCDLAIARIVAGKSPYPILAGQVVQCIDQRIARLETKKELLAQLAKALGTPHT